MTTAEGHQAWAPRTLFFTAVFFLWIAFSLGTCAVSSLFSPCIPVKLRMTQPALPHNMLLCHLPASSGQQLPLFDMLNQAPPARHISHSYCFISVASSELCILIFDVWNLSWFKDYPGEFSTPGDEWSGRKSQPFHTEGRMESFTDWILEYGFYGSVVWSRMVCTQAISSLGCQVFELSCNIFSQAKWRQNSNKELVNREMVDGSLKATYQGFH